MKPQSVLASLRRPFGPHLSVGVTGQIQKSTHTFAPPPSPDAIATPFGALTGRQSDCRKAFIRRCAAIEKNDRTNSAKRSRERSRTTSDAIQRTPLINLTQQISPVISVTTSFGFKRCATGSIPRPTAIVASSPSHLARRSVRQHQHQRSNRPAPSGNDLGKGTDCGFQCHRVRGKFKLRDVRELRRRRRQRVGDARQQDTSSARM